MLLFLRCGVNRTRQFAMCHQVADWDEKWVEKKGSNFWEEHQHSTMTGISYLAQAKVMYVYTFLCSAKHHYMNTMCVY